MLISRNTGQVAICTSICSRTLQRRKSNCVGCMQLLGLETTTDLLLKAMNKVSFQAKYIYDRVYNLAVFCSWCMLKPKMRSTYKEQPFTDNGELRRHWFRQNYANSLLISLLHSLKRNKIAFLYCRLESGICLCPFIYPLYRPSNTKEEGFIGPSPVKRKLPFVLQTTHIRLEAVSSQAQKRAHGKPCTNVLED